MRKTFIITAAEWARQLTILALLFSSAGCGKKAEIELKIRQAEVALAERHAALKAIKDTPVGDLGKLSNPRPSHIDELKVKLTAAERELDRVKQERDATAAGNADMRRQIDEYLGKYATP